MKLTITKLLVSLFIFLSSPYVNANIINVEISNINTNKPGNILIMLFGKDGFPIEHQKALDIKIKPALTSFINVSFDNVNPIFAIKVLHDEDENGQVTKNWLGLIPTEGMGFSNGAKLNFGPPSFKDAKLIMQEVDPVINLTIIYP
ncbi:DUF2141 domain-containing protein [Pseudoalteromonas sp. C2R02]|uniref:DUF2141 domain-containing protein n=1 Tax=Pseudoalteromonas sp. C2R02 TaxID=2841565 RepID=UPI001C091F3F|nr:DUF2141 domain-containing protein [Pseudoalteromonas sp. C2R02]MBU2968235.1 DUF2141 domain-containing protein [Pseudoalteromonas sp. C2R02]